MEIYISQQLALFSGAALLGAVLGLAYDLLRSVRRRWQRLLAVCDVLFCLAVAAGSIGYTLRAAGESCGSTSPWAWCWERGCISWLSARCCVHCGTSGSMWQRPFCIFVRSRCSWAKFFCKKSPGA